MNDIWCIWIHISIHQVECTHSLNSCIKNIIGQNINCWNSKLNLLKKNCFERRRRRRRSQWKTAKSRGENIAWSNVLCSLTSLMCLSSKLSPSDQTLFWLRALTHTGKLQANVSLQICYDSYLSCKSSRHGLGAHVSSRPHLRPKSSGRVCL